MLQPTRSDGLLARRESLFPALQRRLLPLLDRLAAKIHVEKHYQRAVETSRVTHERPFIDGSTRLGGVTVGLTISELHAVRAKEGVEFIQVVDTQGNSNLETVLWRKPIIRGARVELQGPAINTCATGGGLPIDIRLVGIGITGDAVDRRAREAVSYTVEAKIHLSDVAILAGSGGVAMAAGVLGTGAPGTWGDYVVKGCALAVPLVGGLIALSTSRWALKVVRSSLVPPSFKALAVSHAVSDCARIFFPLAGTLANAALVGISLAHQHYRHRTGSGRHVPVEPAGA